LREPFDKYVSAVATLLIGLVLGFLLTAGALQEGYGFAPLVVGPWVAWPQTGAPEADPYARAVLARRGEAALARDLGLVFSAHSDSSGAPLDGHCEYRIFGPAPVSRFWTLELAAPNGAPVANAAERHMLTSTEILRREGGGFEIALAREARSGNWLPTGDVRNFVLVLRLYETSLDIGAKPDPAAFPAIRKLACA
jgi:hypothetical protein